ncbi:MAG: Glu/Leu/Phe/Val dehydrogenase family protein [SAR324 cluster bacterium]|nr:Glu/Leu/Phe/Val dehydrogenase family protein [SAR324 cluster bacterium]
MTRLFDILDREDLTNLRVNYNWRTDQFLLRASKRWDRSVQWSNYNKLFVQSTPLIYKEKYLCHEEVELLFANAEEQKYLEEVKSLLKKGKHQFIDCLYCKEFNIRFISNVHSDLLGLNNRRSAKRAGGIRRHGHDEAEIDVIIDGLNLSRAMSFKNYAAKVPYGGSKITVIMDELDLNNLDVIGFLAYCLDHAKTFTGPDMGFPIELADVMGSNFTTSIGAGPKGPLGSSGIPTAYGVYLAAKEAANFKFGSADLKGRTVAVQGLGEVGRHLAEYYLQEEVNLIVADRQPQACEKLVEKYATRHIRVVPAAEILNIECDILSPCAVGGIITVDTVADLKAKIIIGGANNQLKASSQEQEFAIAKALLNQGILFQVSWWHNVGGVISGCEEYERQNEAKKEDVLAKVDQLVPVSTRENLKEAALLGISPTENCYRIVEKVIYP